MSKLKWKAPLDPVELKDYVVDWTAEMTASVDTIAAATFTLPDDAVADGLEIDSQSFTDTDMTVWLNVPDAGNQAAIVGKGPYKIEATVTTDAARVLNVGPWLTIADK